MQGHELGAQWGEDGQTVACVDIPMHQKVAPDHQGGQDQGVSSLKSAGSAFQGQILPSSHCGPTQSASEVEDRGGVRHSGDRG